MVTEDDKNSLSSYMITEKKQVGCFILFDAPYLIIIFPTISS